MHGGLAHGRTQGGSGGDAQPWHERLAVFTCRSRGGGAGRRPRGQQGAGAAHVDQEHAVLRPGGRARAGGRCGAAAHCCCRAANMRSCAGGCTGAAAHARAALQRSRSSRRSGCAARTAARRGGCQRGCARRGAAQPGRGAGAAARRTEPGCGRGALPRPRLHVCLADAPCLLLQRLPRARRRRRACMRRARRRTRSARTRLRPLHSWRRCALQSPALLTPCAARSRLRLRTRMRCCSGSCAPPSARSARLELERATSQERTFER